MYEILIPVAVAIGSAGLTILATNKKYAKAKKLLTLVVDAARDNKLTKEEMNDIIKAIVELTGYDGKTK